MSASQALRIMTFGFRPWEAMPRYSRAGAFEAGSVWAKKESRRSGPGGGNTCVSGRAKSAWIWSCARRTVAALEVGLDVDSVGSLLRRRLDGGRVERLARDPGLHTLGPHRL